MILSIVSLYIIGVFATEHWLNGLGWATLCVVLQVGPPALFFSIRLRQGIYSDEDVSVRQQRNELYLFSFITLMAGTALLLWLHSPFALVAFLVSGIALNLVAWVINLFWKISVHSASAALCATVATIYFVPLGVVLWIAALLVGWSRVRTRNHTPLQVLAGYLMSATIVFGVFRMAGLI
jgi:membrane-associated phospholipid phosphatase